jgi:energy-converting hydrogenase Eha subunit E
VFAVLLQLLEQALKGPTFVSDFDPVWFGARVFASGGDPYAAVGPGRAFEWLSPLYYPGNALLAMAPFGALPLQAARLLFAAVSAALLAYAVTRDGMWRIIMFLSAPFWYAAIRSQWSPLIAAATLLPALGVLAALKPTVGAAVVFAQRNQRTQLITIIASAALLLASLLVDPVWPRGWLASIKGAAQITAPIAHWRVGAPVLLLALLRWRRPEARLLVALACVPQSTIIYEGLYFMLIPRTRRGLLVASLGSYVGYLWQSYYAVTSATLEELHYGAGDALVACFYLPALVAILRRPNEGDTPAWMDYAMNRIARYLPRVRQQTA